METQKSPGKVCVTGAAGFFASWLVKRLLERGYHVTGTVRDPGMIKTCVLLEYMSRMMNLTLFDNQPSYHSNKRIRINVGMFD